MIPRMSRMLFILSVSFGSIVAGYGLQRLIKARFPRLSDGISPFSRRLKLIAFFILNPIALLSTFWALEIPDSRILGLPILGVGSVLVGMGLAYAATRILKVPPYRAGSVFTCGAFSNVYTMGGLIAYTMFREPGYALVQLFTVAISPVYYMLGYPISANIGRGRKPVFRVSIHSLKENPFLVFPLAAIGLGVIVRSSGIARPELLAGLVGIIVPCVAGILGTAIGLTLRFTGMRSYALEIAAVLVIRHVLLPAILIPAGMLFGFGKVSGGLPLNVIVIVAVMPVAFNSLVPPAIYGFDLDLANSAWMISTALLALIVPALFAVIRV